METYGEIRKQHFANLIKQGSNINHYLWNFNYFLWVLIVYLKCKMQDFDNEVYWKG